MTRLILASSSPRRLSLLQSVAIIPDNIISPDIDETPLPREKPKATVLRLAEAKAMSIAKTFSEDAFILSADTIVNNNSKIFDKAETKEDVEKYLSFFSGRRIHINTAISVIKVKNGIIEKSATKLVESSVKFKRINPEEMKHYIASNLGIGAAGGFAIQGLGETLTQWISGSYSGMIGLPLTETLNLLRGLGYKWPQ